MKIIFRKALGIILLLISVGSSLTASDFEEKSGAATPAKIIRTRSWPLMTKVADVEGLPMAIVRTHSAPLPAQASAKSPKELLAEEISKKLEGFDLIDSILLAAFIQSVPSQDCSCVQSSEDQADNESSSIACKNLKAVEIMGSQSRKLEGENIRSCIRNGEIRDCSLFSREIKKMISQNMAVLVSRPIDLAGEAVAIYTIVGYKKNAEEGELFAMLGDSGDGAERIKIFPAHTFVDNKNSWPLPLTSDLIDQRTIYGCANGIGISTQIEGNLFYTVDDEEGCLSCTSSQNSCLLL